MFDETLNIDTGIPLPPDLAAQIESANPSRLVDNMLIRPEGVREISISWTSDSPEARSWIFLNGKIMVGPFMAETKERTVVLPVPNDQTFKIEVHDYYGDNITPNSIEELPQVKPLISWNVVESAVAYRIYHTIYQAGGDRLEAGEISMLLATVPNYLSSPASGLPSPALSRIEIECPIRLEGKNGRWHYFRVETVDQFGRESVNEIVPYFAADLPLPPNTAISRDTQSGLLTFRIIR